MKIEEIMTESPYHTSGELIHQMEYSDSHYMSDGSLNRLYDNIGSAELAGNIVSFYLLKNKRTILRGATKSKKKLGDQLLDSNKIIFVLEFKSEPSIINYPVGISANDILQVDSVAVLSEFKGSGIASYAYGLLISTGFVVVSDRDQFTDGKELWKKMAREAHVQNYKIYLINDTSGFITDDKGNPIIYDGSNIDDSDIWSSGINHSGEHILLLAQ